MEHFIRAYVQRTENHLLRGHFASYSGVFPHQIFFCGQAVGKIGKFRAIKAHAVGAAFQGGRQFCGVFQVGLHAHTHAVAHFGGPVGGFEGAGLPGGVLVAASGVAAEVGLVGAQQHAAAQAVHNDGLPLAGNIHQTRDSRQPRNVQPAREDGRV